jgi:CheY-like chemotaxis protein
MQILVVEDEAALRHTIRAALVASGHRVLEAETGLQALARLREGRPDLVVLDLQMPEMSGWEFLPRFRAWPGCADVPVIVTSAAHRVSLDGADIQAFVEKPFDLDALLDTIDALLAAHQQAGGRAAAAAGEMGGGGQGEA